MSITSANFVTSQMILIKSEIVTFPRRLGVTADMGWFDKLTHAILPLAYNDIPSVH